MLCLWHRAWLSRYRKTLTHLHRKSGLATCVKPSVYSTSLCLSLEVFHFLFGCIPIKLYLPKQVETRFDPKFANPSTDNMCNADATNTVYVCAYIYT